MNQELEEKTVKKLFHEMKREDERRAPSFASVEAAARARFTHAQLSNARRPPRAVRVAVAASLLIALAGAAIIFYRQGIDERRAPELSSSQPVIPEPFVLKQVDPPATLSQSVKAERLKDDRLKVKRLKIARQRARVRAHQSSPAISRWRSPTDFLLKGSDEQLLKSVPRLSDSIIEIKSIIPIERN